MAISRAQLLKELLPGLNALFGMEYAKYGEEHAEIFDTESSDRSFEEETKLSGFSAASVKNEGAAIEYDNAQEAFTARYTHETVAMGFSIGSGGLSGHPGGQSGEHCRLPGVPDPGDGGAHGPVGEPGVRVKMVAGME